MKVAFVLPSFLTSLGGAETYAFSLAQHVAKCGVDVTFLVSSKQSRERLVSNNFRVLEFKTPTISADPGSPFSIDMARKLLADDFDIVHVHQLRTVCNLVCSGAAKIKRTPVVVTDHGGGWMLAPFSRVCALLPHAFFAVSMFSLNWLSRLSPKKGSTVVYAGIDTESFRSGYDTSDLRNRLGIDDDRIVLYVGRILPHKGVDVLVRIVPQLPKNCKLLIAGPTHDLKYHNYLRNLTRKFEGNRVIFFGEAAAQDLPSLYNLCDVFVQPSLYYDYRGRYYGLSELLGLSKLEAMACGKPVVVSNVGGLPELIQNEKTGFVVNPGDQKNLANVVRYLLSNPEVAHKVGREAQSFVENELNWSIVANHVIESYQNII